MPTFKKHIAAIVVAASLTPWAATAHQAGNAGAPAPAQAATRSIVISLSTKAVSVNKGDIVTFEVDGKRFTWQFDTLRDDDRFALAAIAPAGINTHDVWVYVSPNPLFVN